MSEALAPRAPWIAALARLNAVDVVLWALRAVVILVVVAGTIGTIIQDRYTAAQWVDFVVFGLTIGSIYAQIALGYTMVYGVLRLINFAHGDFVMSGAFAGYFVAQPLDRSGFLQNHPVLGMGAILIVAVLTSTSVALLTERIAYRPFRRVVGLAPLICAIGVSFFLEQTFRGMFGSAVKLYPSPAWQRANFDVFGFHIPRVDLLVIVLAVLFMAGLYLIVQRTRMGTAMRAVAEDGEAAALMGIDVNKVVVFTFILGGVMAGIAAEPAGDGGRGAHPGQPAGRGGAPVGLRQDHPRPADGGVQRRPARGHGHRRADAQRQVPGRRRRLRHGGLAVRGGAAGRAG